MSLDRACSMSWAITAETLARPPAFWTRAKATARSRRQSSGAMVMAVEADRSAGVDAAGARGQAVAFFAEPRAAAAVRLTRFLLIACVPLPTKPVVRRVDVVPTRPVSATRGTGGDMVLVVVSRYARLTTALVLPTPPCRFAC